MQKNGANNTILLVCSDIFGISPALQAFFSSWRGALLLLSPYSKQQHFSDDKKAYQYFQQQGGLDSYRLKLRQTLNQLAIQQLNQPKTVIAVGFSAGAAAIWCELGLELATTATQLNQSRLVQQAFCFYAGQIRHFPELTPCCPTTLIWTQEPHFDVKALSSALADKHNVSQILCRYHHGFINPKSGGYHKQGAVYYQRWLMAKLQQEAAVIKTDVISTKLT